MVPFAHWQSLSGRWARDKRFKLYNDGRFYDVPADTLEESDLTGEEPEEGKTAREALAKVHEQMPPYEERGAKYRNYTKEQCKEYGRFIKRR